MDEALANAQPWQFKKGGDPRRFGGGRTRKIVLPDGRRRTLAEIAREATYESIMVLRGCVQDEDEDMSTRCRAAGYLLSLGWGAAPKEVGLRLVGNQDGAALNLVELLQLVSAPAVVVDEEPPTDAVVVVQDGSAA